MKNLGLYDNNLSIPRKQDIEAVKELIPTKISELVNDSGYIISAPVTSVNGETGDVIISALKIVLQSTQPTEQAVGDFWYKIKS